MKQFINKSFPYVAKWALVVSFALLIPQTGHSQDTIAHRFSFSAAAGLGYNRFHGVFWSAELPYIPGVTDGLNTTGLGYSPKIMRVFEADILYRLNDNRYLGLTFAQHTSVGVLNVTRPSVLVDAIVAFTNFKYYNKFQHFGIEYREEFIPRLHFGVGLSYFVENRSSIYLWGIDPIAVTFRGMQQRLDQLALSASLAYYFPVNYYFQIGIRTKGFLTVQHGLLALTLTPVLKFSF
jgi:hypothetical protein